MIKYSDIARDAGVGNSIVSSLFSGNYYGKQKGSGVGIGKATRERVWASCRKVGYRPDDPVLLMEIYPEEADVIFLLNRESGNFTNPFFSAILDGLIDEAGRNDVNLVLGRFDGVTDYMQEPGRLPNAVKNNPTGKYVFAGAPNYSLILSLIQSGAKLVHVARHITAPGVVSVVPDFYSGSRQAIRYLHEEGVNPIAVVAASHFAKQAYNTTELLRGCADAFKEQETRFTFEDLLYTSGELMDNGQLEKLLTGRTPVKGIFGFDETSTVECVRWLEQKGLPIPERIVTVGTENHPANSTGTSAIVRLPMHEIGRKAFARVTDLAVGGVPEQPELETFPVELT